MFYSYARSKEIEQELESIRAKKLERDKLLKRDENTKSVAALLQSEIAAKAGTEKHPVSPTGSDALTRRVSDSPLRAGVSPSPADVLPSRAGVSPFRAGVSPSRADVSPSRVRVLPSSAAVSPLRAAGGVAVAKPVGGEEPFDRKIDLPPERAHGLRLVLSRSCVKQPKVSLVPQSVTLEELSGSFSAGCSVAPELLATMDWRGKHTRKGSSAYTNAKFVINRAQELVKSELSNPRAEQWQPGPAGRGHLSPIL